MQAQHSTSCGCEKQWGHDKLPNTAPSLCTTPQKQQREWLSFLPTPLTPKHSKSQSENHSAWVTNTWLLPAWLPQPAQSTACICWCLINLLKCSVLPKFATDKRGGNGNIRPISFQQGIQVALNHLPLICNFKHANYFRTVWLTKDRDSLWGTRALHSSTTWLERRPPQTLMSHGN